MVIVDSSVWIDLIRGRETPQTVAFESVAQNEEIGLGDLMLYEVLRGVTPADRLEKIKSHLLSFAVFTMGGRDIALEAVRNSLELRKKGVQPQTVDCLIATFCIVSGSRLLTSDRDFEPFESMVGLRLVR